MGSKTRLSSYCTKQDNDTVNLVTSHKINTRLVRPMMVQYNITFLLWSVPYAHQTIYCPIYIEQNDLNDINLDFDPEDSLF